MVVEPLRRTGGAALLGLLAFGLSTLDSAHAQSRSFPTTTAPASAQASRIAAKRASYGRLPLSFEENKGLAPSDVGYVARGQGFSLALTATEARFTLRKAATKRATDRSALSSGSHSSLLRMQLDGCRQGITPRGQHVLPGKVNYLLGRDAATWRTGISTYREVSYKGIYPGVDLVYYGNQTQLEYDFVVAPRADPSRIALKFSGADRLTVDRTGSLVVRLKDGSVRWHAPRVYQQLGAARKPVGGRFVLKGGGRVGFQIARYDTQRPLIIDPVLLYSTYIGGSGDDQAFSIAIDSVGDAYIAGNTTSADFPGAGSGFKGTSQGFISKLDPTGSTLIYSTYLGGTGDTNCWGIAVDAAGNAYVAGDTSAANFPVVRGYSGASFGGALDAFVTRLNPAGNALVYSTYLGGSGLDTAQGIALGPNGNAYVVGYTDSTNFPAANGFQKANGGSQDAFVAILNTAANGLASLVYSTFVGGSGVDQAFGITVDSAGRFYITGSTTSADFPTATPYQGTLLSFQNAFVSAFSADGTQLSYSTMLGGTGMDTGFAVAVDGARNAYITGMTSSTDFPVRNPFQAASAGANDAFVAKFNTAAQGDASLVYSTYIGGPADDAGRSIAVDVWGNAYIAGDTDSNFTPFSGSDPFVAKLGADGSKLLYGALVGGRGFEANLGIAIDPGGTAYVTGHTTSTDFPVTPGAFQTALAGKENAFVFKLPTFTKLDFNHTNQSDFVFQNTTNGNLVYWLMSGDRETRLGFLTPSNPGANWNLAATADLNGDNNTDLLFQNSSTGDMAYWLMNGTTETSIGTITPKNPGANWQVVGMGDFNRDGYSDILFQNSASFDLYVWNMQGTSMISGGFLNPRNPGVGWKVVAVGDLNGDGQPDILFQNTASGNLYVWYMHGSALLAGSFLNPANPGAGWNVVGLADLNFDGQPEIIFQNSGSGQLAYWVMNGATVVYSALTRPSNPGGAVWRLAGPR